MRDSNLPNPFIHAIYYLSLSLLFLVSCEKDKNYQPTETQPCTSSTDVNSFLSDSSFYHSLRLSMVDNRVVEAYLEEAIDSTELVAIFDNLGIPEDRWFDENAPSTVEFEDFMVFADENHSQNGISAYFREVEYHGANLLRLVTEEYSCWPAEQLREKMMEAAPVVLDQIRNEKVEILQKNDCLNCYRTFDVCADNNRDLSWGILGGGLYVGVQIVAYTSWATGPISWAAGGVSVLTGVVGGGINLAVGYSNCQRSLRLCLDINECGGYGNGGPLGGNPLEWVDKE